MSGTVLAKAFRLLSWSGQACGACGAEESGPFCITCLSASSAAHAFIPQSTLGHRSLGEVVRIGRYFRGSEISPLASALLRFKYAGDRSAGHRLRRLFALAAHTLPAHFEVVVPVPLHPKRLRQRGYNQAAWLARGTAHALRLVLLPRALTRVHDTAPQASVGGGQRRALRGAFRSSGSNIAGKAVLLIDDVFTTGATAADAARVLLAGGARRVGLAVLLVAGHDAPR